MEQNSVFIMIKKICLEFEKRANKSLAPYDITHPQYKTLKYLYKNPPASIRQIDIEKKYSLTNPTVTGIVKNLEKKGYIERLVNPHDPRSKVIRLTDKAYTMQPVYEALGDELEKELTVQLSDQEHQQLLALLGKLEVKS